MRSERWGGWMRWSDLRMGSRCTITAVRLAAHGAALLPAGLASGGARLPGAARAGGAPEPEGGRGEAVWCPVQG